MSETAFKISGFQRQEAAVVEPKIFFTNIGETEQLRQKLLHRVFVQFPKIFNIDASLVIGQLPPESAAGLSRALRADRSGKFPAVARYASLNRKSPNRPWGVTEYEDYRGALNEVSLTVEKFYNYSSKKFHFTENELMDMFFAVADVPVTHPYALAARKYYYENILEIPSALKDYHLKHLAILKEKILNDDNPHIEELTAGLSRWKRMRWKERKDLSGNLLSLIAEAYGIPEPVFYDDEPESKGEGVCIRPSEASLRSLVRVNKKVTLSSTKSARNFFLEVITHEGAGHAVENVLIRRVMKQLHSALRTDLQDRYPRLDTRTKLGKAALMLTFNDSSCPNGHYFKAEKEFQAYKNQLNEALASWVEAQAAAFIIEPLEARMNAQSAGRHLAL